MMHAAPAAPSAPAIVAVIRPPLLKFDRPPCAESAPTGTSTPIRKYATPTHSSALSGFPSCDLPLVQQHAVGAPRQDGPGHEQYPHTAPRLCSVMQHE